MPVWCAIYSNAFAACTPASPGNGDTVTCTGTGNPAFIAPWTTAPSLTTDLSVNIQSGASITGLAPSAGSGSSAQNSAVLVFDGSTVTNYGTVSPAISQLKTRDNVGVNLEGSDTTLDNYGSISLTNDGSVSNTYRLYGVDSTVPSTLPDGATAFPEDEFDDVHVINEAGATISVTETGTATGVARGVYSGENIGDLTLDNYGSISVSRVASAGYSSSTVLAAVDSDDDTDTLIVNNHEGASISATGANSYTVGGRAGDYQINNDGTITNTGGKAAILIWLGGDDDDNTAEIDNSATGTINGDVILSDELPLSPSATTYSRDSTFTNEGTVNGSFYYYGLGAHSLDNSGTINGSINVDQTLYSSTSGGDGPPSITLTNEGTLTGDITIKDVATAENSITLTGDGFSGNVSTTGNGSNALILDGVTQIASINNFSSLDLQESNVWVEKNGTTTTPGVNLVAGATLATTIYGAGGKTEDTATTNLGSLAFASGSGSLNLAGATTIVPTLAGIARNGDYYVLADSVTGDTGDITVSSASNTALVTWTAETYNDPELLLEAHVANANTIPGISQAGAATVNALLNYGGDNAAVQTLGGAVESLTDPGSVRSAAEQLRPEVNGASIQVPLAIADQFESQVSNRIETFFYGELPQPGAAPEGLPNKKGGYVSTPVTPDNGIWFNAIGSNTSQQEVDNVSGYRADTGGFVGGYDHLITDNFRLGGAIGYGTSAISDYQLAAHTSLDSVNGLIYGAFTGTNWYTNVVGQYGGLHYDESRNINFDGFSDTAGAGRSGSLYSGHVDGGYAFLTPFAAFVPIASLTYAHITQAGYSESSQNGAGLTVQQQQTDSLQSGLGGKVIVPLTISPTFGAALEGHAYWLHEFDNTAENVWASFVGTDASFQAIGPAPSRDSADVGADLRISLPVVGDTFSVGYNAIVRSQYIEQAAVVRARFDF